MRARQQAPAEQRRAGRASVGCSVPQGPAPLRPRGGCDLSGDPWSRQPRSLCRVETPDRSIRFGRRRRAARRGRSPVNRWWAGSWPPATPENHHPVPRTTVSAPSGPSGTRLPRATIGPRHRSFQGSDALWWSWPPWPRPHVGRLAWRPTSPDARCGLRAPWLAPRPDQTRRQPARGGVYVPTPGSRSAGSPTTQSSDAVARARARPTVTITSTVPSLSR